MKVLKKLTTMLFFFTLLLGVSSCGPKHPWVGEWKPSSGDDNGIFEFYDDGEAVYNLDADDGSVYIKGVWEEVPGKERTISIKFDPSTIKVDADNEIVKAALQYMAPRLCEKTHQFTFSEDYEKADSGQGFSNGFVKV